MHKLPLFLGLLASLSFVNTYAGPLALKNPGFEEGIAGWKIVEPEITMSTVSPEAAHEGKAGLKVDDASTSLSSKVYSSPVPVEAGKTYKLTFWAKTSTPNRIGVFFRFNKADGQMFGQEERPYCTIDKADGKWNEYTLEARAPEGAVSLMLWIHSYSTMTGLTDLDDFALEESGASTGPASPAPAASPASSPAAKPRAATSQAPPAALPRSGPAKIIIKADDLRNRKGVIDPRWTRFIDFVKERKIKVSIGIICNSLDGDFPQYFQAIKELHATGLVEFWNHGYDHLEWKEGEKKVFEFQGSTYEHQREHFTRSNQLAKEKLGFSFRTFGAPFNVTDEHTETLLANDPEIQIWLYGKQAKDGSTAGKLILDRRWDVNIEQPLFVPNAQKFIDGFTKHPESDYFVIQGHPWRWDDAGFAEFEKIVDFALKEGAIFVTPSEYAEMVRAQNPSAPGA